MKKIIRTAAAAAAFTMVGVGLAGAAAAAEPGYAPTPPTTASAPTTVPVEVEAVTQVSDPAGEAVVAATTAGTLPYTGSDSSLPLAEAGVLLLAVGGALLLVVKHRQAEA